MVHWAPADVSSRILSSRMTESIARNRDICLLLISRTRLLVRKSCAQFLRQVRQTKKTGCSETRPGDPSMPGLEILAAQNYCFGHCLNIFWTALRTISWFLFPLLFNVSCAIPRQISSFCLTSYKLTTMVASTFCCGE